MRPAAKLRIRPFTQTAARRAGGDKIVVLKQKR
jgi:hypothetical protein